MCEQVSRACSLSLSVSFLSGMATARKHRLSAAQAGVGLRVCFLKMGHGVRLGFFQDGVSAGTLARRCVAEKTGPPQRRHLWGKEEEGVVSVDEGVQAILPQLRARGTAQAEERVVGTACSVLRRRQLVVSTHRDVRETRERDRTRSLAGRELSTLVEHQEALFRALEQEQKEEEEEDARRQDEGDGNSHRGPHNDDDMREAARRRAVAQEHEIVQKVGRNAWNMLWGEKNWYVACGHLPSLRQAVTELLTIRGEGDASKAPFGADIRQAGTGFETEDYLAIAQAIVDGHFPSVRWLFDQCTGWEYDAGSNSSSSQWHHSWRYLFMPDEVYCTIDLFTADEDEEPDGRMQNPGQEDNDSLADDAFADDVFHFDMAMQRGLCKLTTACVVRDWREGVDWICEQLELGAARDATVAHRLRRGDYGREMICAAAVVPEPEGRAVQWMEAIAARYDVQSFHVARSMFTDAQPLDRVIHSASLPALEWMHRHGAAAGPDAWPRAIRARSLGVIRWLCTHYDCADSSAFDAAVTTHRSETDALSILQLLIDKFPSCYEPRLHVLTAITRAHPATLALVEHMFEHHCLGQDRFFRATHLITLASKYHETPNAERLLHFVGRNTHEDEWTWALNHPQWTVPGGSEARQQLLDVQAEVCG